MNDSRTQRLNARPYLIVALAGMLMAVGPSVFWGNLFALRSLNNETVDLISTVFCSQSFMYLLTTISRIGFWIAILAFLLAAWTGQKTQKQG